MRRIATSLRLRLLFGTLLWIVASIAATGWLLQQMFSDHLARQFDHELNIHLNQLRPASNSMSPAISASSP